jgi:hypothetical protein
MKSLQRPVTRTTIIAVLLWRIAAAGIHCLAQGGGPQGGDVLALAIDPGAPTTLYVGTGSGGVFKSTNSGSNWIAVNSGLTGMYVSDLSIDPSTPATLYAGASSGVFKSTNGAGSWTPVNSGLTSTDVRVLTMSRATH